jgi:SM-20-related protein
MDGGALVRERIARELATVGASVCREFLAGADVERLRREALELHRAGAFHRAGVGPGGERRVAAEIRDAEILWLREPLTPGQRLVLDEMERLRLAINRTTFLGLFDLEAHLAIFPAGGFYRRHLDRFAGDGGRVVSCSLYLNPDWGEDDGGALRLHPRVRPGPGRVAADLESSDGILRSPGETAPIDVLPRGGTLVTFLSTEFPHEVLPARRPRLSLTGWFRLRGSGPGVPVRRGG